VTDKPSLIKVSTLIGYGSPNKADSHDVHGAPLGPEETAATRENLKWPYGEFEVPQEVYDAMRSNVTKGAAAEEQWKAALATYKQKYPKEADEFEGLIQ
jgi:transketolase